MADYKQVTNQVKSQSIKYASQCVVKTMHKHSDCQNFGKQ